MTASLIPFVLIGGLVVLGLLLGLGLVLVTLMRERRDAGAMRVDGADAADEDRAA
jgi:hypothetical protein